MINMLKNCETFAYADDTAIIVAHKSINIASKIMQTELDIATKWCHDNGLIINASKTKIMHIRPPHFPITEISLKFHDTDCLHNAVNNVNNNNNDNCSTHIEIVNNYKYLGIYVDEHFKWKTHITNLHKKLRKSSYMLYHLSNCATFSVLKQAYFSLAESYLRHGITAWGNATYCNTIQVTQNRILKILRNNQRRSANSINNNRYNIQHNNLQINNNNNYTVNNNRSEQNNIAKDLRILNVKHLYYTTLLNDFYNDPRFLKRIDHQHNTRSREQGKYKVERYKNNYGKYTLYTTLPTIFNSVPSDILNTANKLKRKRLLKNFFIDSQ